ncbi:hypothetical protein CULT_930009 [[Clostridium] ultunense Esp]|nr:hypothetical protein CULT_930009 [[Clostridium] ultunense Esp]
MQKKGNKEEIVKGEGLTYEDYARLPEDGPRYELAGRKFVMLRNFSLLLRPLKNKAFLMRQIHPHASMMWLPQKRGCTC